MPVKNGDAEKRITEKKVKNKVTVNQLKDKLRVLLKNLVVNS